MLRIRISVFVFFFLAVAGNSSAAVTAKSYVTIHPQKPAQFKDMDLFMVYLSSGFYAQPLEFENVRIFNLQGTRAKQIKNFSATNVTFYYAKLAGVSFEDCSLKNVKFVRSDLTFMRFNKCQLENVTYENSVLYGHQ